jgi:aspartyl-tRNA(Asn)/glutamyl-tRNA(Gln) amidotransferase subunit A
MDTTKLTITEAGEALRAGKMTVRELVDAVLAAAKKENTETNAYLEFYDDIDEQVVVAERMFKEGKATPLTGIPMGVKDNMLVKGKISSSASKILANHRAVYDGTAIAKLKAAGAILIGRTNMDEFAMGGSNENSAYGPVKNPFDHSRVSGGSSGGSAASVAMGGAIASLGSDTGGSIRQPAAFCGLVGLKPTYGGVSRYGLMSMASSLDQIGPFGKTVEDVEMIFRVIGGHDPMDSTSVPDDHPLKKSRTKKEHLTIGVPEAFVDRKGIDPDVLATFRAAIKKLEIAGHTIKTIELPLLPHALPVYYVLMQAEVSSNMARYDGMRYGLSAEGENLLDVYRRSRGEGFGPEVRRRVLLGTYVLSAGYYDAYYNKAVAVRRKITEELAQAFTEVDLIATPTAPTPAWKLGEKTADPLQMYLEDIFTVPANIAGVPAMSIPMGKVKRDGIPLPVGLQFMAPPFGEDLLFQACKDFNLN